MTKPLRVVSIGGGHGLSALLSGLRIYTRPGRNREGEEKPVIDVTAIVTVTDDGGSSGRLRREFDVLPPGDIRNCMVALSEDSALLSRLFQYRFQAGRGLKGHSFGNLFLTALTEITGDFADAVRSSAEVLNIAGRIFPSTGANVSLEAVLDDGRVVRGETRISSTVQRIREVRLRPKRARPLKETLEAIAQADLITLGPGSLFTSVIPNLLVEGIPQAIRKSPALKACFMNLMSQPGETTNFTASDHLLAICEHSGRELMNCVVVSSSRISARVRQRYAEQNAAAVKYDKKAIERMGIDVIERDLLRKGSLVRHDPEAIARVAADLAFRGRKRRESRA